jgi:hypothetical protein
MQTVTSSPRPSAILHPNGGVFVFPVYSQRFVMEFKRTIPPRARVFHERQKAYVVVAPWHQRALALASEWWLDLERYETPLPYDFIADDAHLVLQRRGGAR